MRDIESRIRKVVTSTRRLCPFLPVTLRRDPRHTVTSMGRGLRTKPVRAMRSPRMLGPGEKGCGKALGRRGDTLGFRRIEPGPAGWEAHWPKALGSRRPESKPS